MSQYVLPSDTGACIEVAGVMSQDQRKIPHASLYKAKLRSMGFHVIVQAGDANVGKTKLLVGFLPAGRARVFFELSTIDADGPSFSGTYLMAAPYLVDAQYQNILVPAHAISGALVAGDMMTSLSTDEGSTIAGDKEFSRPGWGFKYEALEDIPIYIELSAALAAGNEVYGNIVYGQE